MPHGRDILNNARINKGTAFTDQEREALGLIGLLPDGVTSPEHQDRKSTRLNSSHEWISRMPSSA